MSVLDEVCLLPGAQLPREPRRDGEVITYVLGGVLNYDDAMGRSGVIEAGEIQCMTTGSQTRFSGANRSRSEEVRMIQLWIHPSAVALHARLEQRRFSRAERRGELCAVVSPNARAHALPIQQDVSVYSALLDSGKHLVHRLGNGRKAWLHVVDGELALGDRILFAGDGAGVFGEPAVSFTARQRSEVLLVDLDDPPTQASSPYSESFPRETFIQQEGKPMGDKSPKAKAKAIKQDAAAKLKKAKVAVKAEESRTGLIKTDK